MLSVASLLNPIRPEVRGTRLPSSPSSSLTSSHGSPAPSSKKVKMTKDGPVFTKGNKIKGEVNYPPFEHFDEATLQEIEKFQVCPLGKITEYPRHIPYNSEKKTFLEKTGRESFEVFQYTYKVPQEERIYTVLWDYNIGLVRITPFFKCLGHTKTMPAKMLNQNLGLKEITHSITGGALAAQGYWMPYHCARAVCTTFCVQIAPALIPLFGPSFPSQCVPIEAPEFKRMIIPSSIIASSTTQAETYRIHFSGPGNSSPSSSSSYTRSPSSALSSTLSLDRSNPPTIPRRLCMKRTLKTNIYDTESDASGASDTYFCGPKTSNSNSQAWQAMNRASHSTNSSFNLTSSSNSPAIRGPSPWLSAIPRSSAAFDITLPPRTQNGSREKTWRGKRRVREEEEDEDKDREYDGEVEESAGEEQSAGSGKSETVDTETGDGMEKKAAWLLMKLSVRDGEWKDGAGVGGGEQNDGPRVKRRRATSY